MSTLFKQHLNTHKQLRRVCNHSHPQAKSWCVLEHAFMPLYPPGNGCVINTTTSQVVMHKDKFLLPVKVSVRKISGIGEDMMLLGVIEVGGWVNGMEA
jgi:hypothetical protein